jgi:hypothetical protein
MTPRFPRLAVLVLALLAVRPSFATAQAITQSCTTYQLSVSLARRPDSVAFAQRCAALAVARADSIARAKVIKAALAQHRADSIAAATAAAKWIADSLALVAIPNPYPVGLITPPAGTLTTAAQRARFHTDSLTKEYPVDPAGRPCWKFTVVVVAHPQRYRCFRAQELSATAEQYGPLATYFKGQWENYAVAGGPVAPLVAQDGTLTRAVSVVAP